MAATGTLDTLYKLKKEILKSDNDVLVSQIDHAIMKTYKDQLVFSFIGHYSAGKSSLINHLLDQDILPSSPVPTTSNTVSVEIGTEQEIQAFVDQYRYIPLASYAELRNLNTRDLDITSISMNVSHPQFSDRTVFQDTPGVDSNTRSHEESANRFLLNSDYIFFTVEYNHVESEHNMKLLKEISELEIPFSLIINQIDKHDDAELLMETFMSRIKKTLGHWNVAPAHIFTTSIYETSHNEVEQVCQEIVSIEADRPAYQERYHDRIIHNIEYRQLQYLEDIAYDIETTLELTTSPTMEAVDEQITYLDNALGNNALSRMHEDEAALRTHVQSALKDIVTNSYLYPHQVKTAIEDYLRARAGEIQPGGLFGKKKKAQALVESYKQQIGDEIGPVLQTEINAPINSLFDTLRLRGAPFKYTWKADLLIEEGITALSSAYISNYLDKLKRAIGSDITKLAMEHMAELEIEMQTQTAGSLELTSTLESYTSLKRVFELIQSIQTQNYRHFYIHLDDEMEKLDMTEAISKDFGEVRPKTPNHRDNATDTPSDEMDTAYYRKLVEILTKYPRYDAYRNIIMEKLERIEKGEVNISVFGGFSAGKTTFVNALLGGVHLTTSPNPTTATITEISGGTESHALFKTEADLVQSLKVISNKEGSTVQDFLPWVKQNRRKVSEAHIPFIDGILSHYDTHSAHLGKDIVMETAGLIDMISTDEEAIFIHKAFLSIDTAFTDRFTIIDSPGINSINDRHTKETNSTIAGSDMIIYVSYYNHVFSKSDERFLQYIKSIKGPDFPILFIVNAVDLMQSEEDLTKVLGYIQTSLEKLEISHRIFPVSSRQALGPGDARFDTAKDQIVSIASHNASYMQYQSMQETARQLQRTVEGNKQRYHDQHKMQAEIEAARSRSIEAIDGFTATATAPTLHQELDIILSHTKKQLTLKLYDQLKGLISPSDMNDARFISDNQAYLVNTINHHLGLETATSFNAIYHKAQREIDQMVGQLNEGLKETQTAQRVDTSYGEYAQPSIEIDASQLIQYEKPLARVKNRMKDFRSLLLELSEAIINSIDDTKMKDEMVHMIDDYLKTVDERMGDQLVAVRQALSEPLPEISQADHEADITLAEAISHLEGVTT
ncbi:dynamin family protein [Salinicoccus sesuvii]|uniref:Dynamin family protein n=1 Tax=Salinicoccus sesuvii TaxID=868281 RepID=A0ABV7N7G0_9STAP